MHCLITLLIKKSKKGDTLTDISPLIRSKRFEPAPDGVLDAIKNLGCNKDDAVYIGDSEVDFATAKNSGLDFIGVSWGYRGREFLENLGAETIVDSPDELKQFFI